MIEDLKKQFLSTLLATILVSSILYLCIPEAIIPITLLAFLAQNFLFAFFNKVRKSNANFAVVLYIVAFLAVYMVICLTKTWISAYGYPGYFIMWFFGFEIDPEAIVPYSYISFIWLNILFSFAVYYFTQVVYRSTVLLLIIFIPFIIYMKRLQSVSYFYILLILALYISIMVYHRHFQQKKRVSFTIDRSCKKSVVIFVLCTLIISLLIPKAAITPIGGSIGQLLEGAGIKLAANNQHGDIWGDEGHFSSEAYGEFSKFSSGGSDQLSDQIIYKVIASEGLYLRRQVFDLYQGENWTCVEKYGSRGRLDWYKGRDKKDFRKFIEVIKTVADHDKDFLEKYHLTEFPQLNNNKKTAKVTLNNHSSYIVLSLNNIKNISGITPRLYGTLNDNLFMKSRLDAEDSYTISYYSEAAEINYQSIEFLRKFNKDKFERMLDEAAFSIYNAAGDFHTAGGFNEQLEIVYYYFANVQEAYEYYENTYREPSPRIAELAGKITEGLDSDYDKAKALEEYFQKNGYVYDLSYQPEKGNEGAEYFIFESKRGSCSNYATAMTLMARAIGLPARYVEGFLMTEKEDISTKKRSSTKEDATTYVVRAKDGHAFTEVFIAGYGWMTFDATVSGELDEKIASAANTNNEKNKMFTQEDLHKFLVFTLGGLLFLGLIIILRPFANELIFRVRLKFLKNNAAILLIYAQLQKRFNKKLKPKICGLITKSLTAKMIQEKIAQVYGINIAELTCAFEKAYYGGKTLTTDERLKSYQLYIDFYQASKWRIRR